ncbi:MAG TPA: DUF6603 domain-containing protein [Actinophytocola sp.]|uniref:DUF6603 domain-containing protein n=1 Tax=Actinophytocola sp. TaxID=1872138 RepID=UPI002DDD75C3|nr:DUF6603 domain-containing protein [Actinophytocola sp.]HEV2784245.1 DUF6603 domain-containing protein [Actinophytocola sp.]
MSDLKVYFEQSIQDQTLVLTAANSVVPALVTFVGGLPAEELRLPSPEIRLDAGELTVAATTDEQWPTGGTGTRALHLTGVRLGITQPGDFAVDLRLTGSVAIGGNDVPVEGAVADNLITVRTPAGPARSLPLTALADYVSDNKLSGYLPAGVAIFNSVPLTALRLSFGYGRDAVTELEITSTLEKATWDLIDKLAGLKDIGVTLTSSVRYQHGRYVERIGGDIHATLHFEQDFRVRLAMQGQTAWALEIQPADGNVLPGLTALANLVGGDTLVKRIPQSLGELSITGVSIGFDMATRALQQIAVSGRITIDGITFDIVVYLPDFAFHGSLSPSSPIHLSALVDTYFSGGKHFPEIDLTELNISAIPGIGHYGLEAGVTGTWVFDVGPVPVGFQQFNFEINKDPTGLTGYIEGVFSLFDATFEVIAEHPEADGGWQFTAQSLPGQALTIKAIHDHIVRVFGVDSSLPAVIESLALDNLKVWFDTSTRNFGFTCEAKFSVDDTDVDIMVTIRLDKIGTGYQKTFGGQITVGGLVFDLKFVQDTASTVFVAVYSHTGEQQPLKIRDLVAAVSSSLAAVVPADLEIDLRDVIFAVSKGTQPGFLFGLDLGAEFGLSQLPLVGKEFPPDRKVGVDSLRLLVASRDFTVGEIGPINTLLPAGVPALPDVSRDARQGQPPPPAATVGLAKGVTVTARLLLGDAAAQTLSLPAADAGGGTGGSVPAIQSASGPAVTGSDSTRWFDVQRSFGPVHFERVGFEYQNKNVRFLLDAALSAAGLTLSMEGLALGSAIDHFAPSVDLRGLGVDYRSGPVEIGGALLRTRVTPATGEPYDEYDGAALIRTEKLTLAALGSYAYLNGQPSLFIYAVLDQALGGPPFFFVTGLAAGFGYNRTIVVPPVERVADFPLITAAKSPQPITGTANPRDLLNSTLDKLRPAVPPAAGGIFLAIGVKFLSFRIIDSFALIIASFGQRFELNLLGLSTVVAPTPEAGQQITPLAEIQLAVRASFIPDEGFLGVSAQLTAASFLFSRDCHLTGGFAFYSWFSGTHAGDFVLSVGGYHPQFRVLDHYPRVPRLGFNWQVDPQLVVKGDGYYALTPVALMAGGHLEAVWQSGNLRATFIAGADFIVAWKPYHYDAHAYVDINVSYTFEFFGTHHINVDLGADLHIWGPEFAGTAHITLSIISFDVTFGPQTQKAPEAIGWPAFSQSFLPESGRCAVAVGGGLIRKSSAAVTDLGVIDPQRLVLLTNTVIPSTGARIRGDLAIDRLYYTVDGETVNLVPFVAADATATPAQAPTGQHKPAGAVAVGPMGIRLPHNDGPHLRSTVTIAITRGTEAMEHHFAFVPVLTHLPAGMWGELGAELRPDPNAATLVRDTLVGFEIRPKLTPDEGTDRASAGGTELLQYHLPALPGGTYHVTVTQDVATDEPAGTKKIPAQQFSAAGDFVVAGIRQALAPDEVYALYPPDGALGDYSADLPHIILNHSTLPWQETADPDRDDLPWLALLLFDDQDLPQPHVVTVGQLRDPATLPPELRGVPFPVSSLGDSQPDGDKVSIIDVPAGHLRELMPAQDAQRRDLALLAHVRRDPSGGERAVIIGNRLPRQGSAHVAHLVSVRGRYTGSGFDLHGATGTTPVRLISLKSWRFTSTGSDHQLTGLLRRIAARSGPLRAPQGSDAARLEQGFVPVTYRPRQGAKRSAWYRGPLTPQPQPTAAVPLPARTADELITDETDVGYAAAWQLGRLLALRSKPFSAALYRWKRARARQRKSGAGELAALPPVLTNWLNDIAVLRGIPFNYLVPDETMLPVESMRFFSLDRRWLASLLDGALSIGRVTPADYELDRTLAADLRNAGAALTPWVAHLLDPAAPTVARSGFLVRSDAVAGWPDLRVVATDSRGAALAPVPGERLSANILLCMFDEEIAAVSIRQPEQTLHFGLAEAASEWQTSPRVVNLTEVAESRIGAPAARQAASARFAAAMLAAPPEVDIHR